MGVILKKQGKKIMGLWLMLSCLFAAALGGSAYAAEPVAITVTPVVEQVFTKPASSFAQSASDSEAFTYELTAMDGANPMPSGSTDGVYTFTIDGTGSASFTITYISAGIYSYEIKQTVYSGKPGYAYDKQIYTMDVYISSGDYGLEREVVIQKSNGEKVSSISFENSYSTLASDPSLMMDAPVKKTVSGAPGENGVFIFKLEAVDEGNPMPSDSANGVKTVTIEGEGEKAFGTWSYTDEGTYYYTVSEVNAGEDGYTYDTSVYTITDFVQDVDGQLVLTRTITNASGEQVSAYTFTNQYSAEGGGTEDTPKTGDDSAIGLYWAMLGVSCVVLAACVVYIARRGKKQR